MRVIARDANDTWNSLRLSVILSLVGEFITPARLPRLPSVLREVKITISRLAPFIHVTRTRRSTGTAHVGALARGKMPGRGAPHGKFWRALTVYLIRARSRMHRASSSAI